MGWMIKIPCPFAGSIFIFLIVFIIVRFFRFLEIIGILVFLISRIISLWLIICKSPTRNFCSCDSKWSKWPNYIPTRFKLFYGNSRLKLFFSFLSVLFFNQILSQLRFRITDAGFYTLGKNLFCLIVTVRLKGEDNCSRPNTLNTHE